MTWCYQRRSQNIVVNNYLGIKGLTASDCPVTLKHFYYCAALSLKHTAGKNGLMITTTKHVYSVT